MTILRASATHLPIAAALLHEYYEAIGVLHRDTPEALNTMLAAPDHAFWIAFVNDEPAGCVALRPLPHLPAALECKRLYVRPAFRGHGIANALLDTMEIQAHTTAATHIYLDSKDDLENAIRLYQKRGYQSCERFNNNPQATIFLRKNLSEIR